MSAELSVVILCYRAGERTYSFVEKITKLLNRFVLSWEIILVANYFEDTGDKTPEIAKEISSKNENIRVVAMPKEGMMGWDARSGLNEAKGKYICLIDGDEQMPYRDIVRVYRKIKSGTLDFVKTYRVIRHDGILRLIISFIYNLLFALLFPGIEMKDANSKPKIFKREAYNKMLLKSDDWFLDAEIMIQARRLKFKIGQIPTKFYKCNYRDSFVKGNTLFEFIKNLFFARIEEFFK
ncbi:MAG: glycosyltransferase family 2 protein [Candidatus Omnitrophica bacterium]|nr:glycosyltransferase family 2 protein [Candidatus Omnitrophota bacterium]